MEYVYKAHQITYSTFRGLIYSFCATVGIKILQLWNVTLKVVGESVFVFLGHVLM
jgi:hypothetical protein